MPTADAACARLRYESDGRGEPVLFVPEAGCGAWLWSWQRPAVAGPFEAISFDPRGVGRSRPVEEGVDGDSDGDEDVDVDALAADCEAVLAAAGARRAHLVGVGLGGMVALRYARRYDRARSLALFGTALSGERIDPAALERFLGDGADALGPAFSDRFREAQPDVVDGIVEWRREGDGPPAVRAAHAAAARGFDCEAPFEVTVPALVVAGADDPVVPLDAAIDLADALPRGRFEALAGRHLAFVESSRAANDLLVGFLEDVTGD